MGPSESNQNTNRQIWGFGVRELATSGTAKPVRRFRFAPRVCRFRFTKAQTMRCCCKNWQCTKQPCVALSPSFRAGTAPGELGSSMAIRRNATNSLCTGRAQHATPGIIERPKRPLITKVTKALSILWTHSKAKAQPDGRAAQPACEQAALGE